MARKKKADGFAIAFPVPKSKLTAATKKKLKPSIDEIKKILEIDEEPVFGRYTAFNAIEVD